MLTPGRENKQMDDLLASYQASKEHLRLHDFEQSLYPRDLMRKAEREGCLPQVLFLPCQKLTRLMIKHAVEQESSYQSEEHFLLRFGLVDNLNYYMYQ
jgi:hypothetical protein